MQHASARVSLFLCWLVTLRLPIALSLLVAFMLHIKDTFLSLGAGDSHRQRCVQLACASAVLFEHDLPEIALHNFPHMRPLKRSLARLHARVVPSCDKCKTNEHATPPPSATNCEIYFCVCVCVYINKYNPASTTCIDLEAVRRLRTINGAKRRRRSRKQQRKIEENKKRSEQQLNQKGVHARLCWHTFRCVC